MFTTPKIEWAETTVVVDRGGRRTRVVKRHGDLSRPGQQERRRRLALGERWCRGCREWLTASAVTPQGLCRPCKNADYRRRYAADGRAIKARVHARKRGVDPVPPIGAAALTELFGGLCAYCPAVATTWDHVLPVASGGTTKPGNVVPACAPCNSSKRASEVIEWLERTDRQPHSALVDVLALDYFMEVG